jgi:hypothetical protein
MVVSTADAIENTNVAAKICVRDAASDATEGRRAGARRPTRPSEKQYATTESRIAVAR